MTSTVTLVWAREPIPTGRTSVFLAGPTPRRGEVPSWRPAAIEALTAQWAGPGPMTVLTPESRDGIRAAHYDDQVDWETEARAAAAAILFWIPRDLRTMPGFTTNVEFGLDVTTGRAVLGCPPGCPNPERNRYLMYVARRHDVPVRETLPDTVAAALAVATHATQPGILPGHDQPEPFPGLARGGVPRGTRQRLADALEAAGGIAAILGESGGTDDASSRSHPTSAAPAVVTPCLHHPDHGDKPPLTRGRATSASALRPPEAKGLRNAGRGGA
jgi:Nucleoside 2-deoxyribosyltransferase like